MITLLEGYSLYRLTQPFSEQSDEFLSQAHVYVVRFRALPTIVETGEKLPRAKPFPAGFPDALDEEIRKRRERTPDPDLGAK